MDISKNIYAIGAILDGEANIKSRVERRVDTTTLYMLRIRAKTGI